MTVFKPYNRTTDYVSRAYERLMYDFIDFHVLYQSLRHSWTYPNYSRLLSNLEVSLDNLYDTLVDVGIDNWSEDGVKAPPHLGKGFARHTSEDPQDYVARLVYYYRRSGPDYQLDYNTEMHEHAVYLCKIMPRTLALEAAHNGPFLVALKAFVDLQNYVQAILNFATPKAVDPIYSER